MSDDLVNGWPCDDRRRDSGCRQPYGCHCREITSLRSVIEAQAAENERLRTDLRTVQNAAKVIAAAHGTELEHLRQNNAFDHKLRAEHESLQARDAEMTDALLAAESRAELAERALAEAVELIDQLSSFQISETLEKTGKLSDLCKAWIEHKKFARQFVKEHGK